MAQEDITKQNYLKSEVNQMFVERGYTVKDYLTDGSFTSIFLAEKDHQYFALKSIDRNHCSSRFDLEVYPREISLLVSIQHDNLVRMYDIFRSAHKIYIIMELLTHGSLAEKLSINGPFTENLASIWLSQIANALRYLHEDVGIPHRNIKLENILFDENDVAKLCDFGYRKQFFDTKTNKFYLCHIFCGCEYYYAPQILIKKFYNEYLADVWALGIVLFAMLHNEFPFDFKNGFSKMLQHQLEQDYEINNNFSDEYKNLQNKMLQVEERKRITSKEVYEDSWTQKVVSNAISHEFESGKIVEETENLSPRQSGQDSWTQNVVSNAISREFESGKIVEETENLSP